MNQLQQERFSRLQFPVHKITAKTPVELFEVMPALRRYFQRLVETQIPVIYPAVGSKPEVRTTAEGYEARFRGRDPEDLVRIVKYIVFVYDPDSDLIDEYPNELRLLKEAAAKEAGFKRLKDGDWPDYVADIIDFKNAQVVSWILDYLKVKKNPIFTQMRFIDEEIESLYQSRAKALIKGEVKSELMTLIKQRVEEREILLKRFYAEHSDLKKNTEEQLFPVSPENVFKELKIPPAIAQVRQVKDVSKTTRVPAETD